MIARKEARRLLDEYLARLAAAEAEADEDLDGDGLAALRDELLAESDLVLRGAENVEQKARRYLVEGRVAVDQVDPTGGLVVATARGSEVYRLGYDPRTGGWRCTCRSGRRGRCSHIAALRLVVSARGPRA